LGSQAHSWVRLASNAGRRQCNARATAPPVAARLAGPENLPTLSPLFKMLRMPAVTDILSMPPRWKADSD